MIFGNINYPEQYDFLPEKFQLCFDFIKNNDLSTMELKTYELDGDKVFASIMEVETVPAEEKQFEAHKKYCDIHYIVNGMERIDFCITDRMTAGEYTPDIFFLNGTAESGSALLQEGDFMICMPQDGHKPGLAGKESSKIRKVLFKVIAT